ncbi:hypothetical protein HRbin17_00087 [bacterium HR17]|jgi:general secretion pathway protein I|uniref:Type II secretion system protein I n=1 Tax=Candidatus Fervidibacter japonicus TaxID=2035412 RepID=A0A2H5X8T5_9BACT|nr:hypothetical protein HRbin17_00087 [bacterium HR17]
MRTNPSAGFTLVELVVAFVILSIGIVAILELVGQSARNARLARNRTQAAMLAQQKMEELLAQPDLQPGNLEGDFGDRYPQFRWSAQVQALPTDSAVTPAPLLQVSVVVEWREGNQPQSVQLDTLQSPVALTVPPPTPPATNGNVPNAAGGGTP